MKELICIVCPKGCHLSVDEENGYAVSGNNCPRGEEYGKNEVIAPKRTVTSTVKISGGLYPRLPVKTDKPIPKELVLEAMKLLDKVELTAPVKVGDVVIENVLGTGVSFVAARNM